MQHLSESSYRLHMCMQCIEWSDLRRIVGLSSSACKGHPKTCSKARTAHHHAVLDSHSDCTTGLECQWCLWQGALQNAVIPIARLFPSAFECSCRDTPRASSGRCAVSRGGGLPVQGRRGRRTLRSDFQKVIVDLHDHCRHLGDSQCKQSRCVSAHTVTCHSMPCTGRVKVALYCKSGGSRP